MTKRRRLPPRARRAVAALLALLLSAAALIFGAGWYVGTAVPPISTALATIAPAPIAIVFGAGVAPDGRPTAALADRVIAAVQLYQAGIVQHLLMSGDNSRATYDEVTVMARLAEERGVPAAAITLDYAGFRTYNSCYRARAIFGVTRAVLVTQAYHLPRALYTCARLGVAATGLAADELPGSNRAYYRYLLPGYIQRERLATVLMLWQVHVTHPLPQFLGSQEPILP